MALEFQTVRVATIKGKLATSNDNITVPGVTADSTTVANAATQINKILDIAGKAIVGDATMTRVLTQEATEE